MKKDIKKNVIFDWSGVVRDTVTSQLWIVNKIFEKYGVKPITLEEFRENWRQPCVEFYKKYLPQDYSENERSQMYKEALFDSSCPKSSPFIKTVEVIKKFKELGYFLAVVSSDLKESLLPEIEEYGLKGIFDEVITDADDKFDAVSKLITDNSLDLKNTFFVGDSNHEIDVSKKTGIKSIAVTWGFTSEKNLRESNPDYVAYDAQDLWLIVFSTLAYHLVHMTRHSTSNSEAIQDHIEKYLGPIENTLHEIVPGEIPLKVHLIPPSSDFNFNILVTDGMSNVSMNTPEGKEKLKYFELAICLPHDWKIDNDNIRNMENYWPIKLLKDMAIFSHEDKSYITYGDVITNTKNHVPYAENTKLCAALFSVSKLVKDEKFHILRTIGKDINFCFVIPIYKEEAEFQLQNGSPALYKLFHEKKINIDVINPDRPNAVL